jgi:hypothetical protein
VLPCRLWRLGGWQRCHEVPSVIAETTAPPTIAWFFMTTTVSTGCDAPIRKTWAARVAQGQLRSPMVRYGLSRLQTTAEDVFESSTHSRRALRAFGPTARHQGPVTAQAVTR